jgi:hypothetical protein
MTLQALVTFIAVVVAACVAIALVGRWWVGFAANRHVERIERRIPLGGDAQPAKLRPEIQYIVALSDVDVSCTHPDNSVERVAWQDLQSVEIVTTDDGPPATDAFWVLRGTTSSCVIPQGATGERQLVERLQELPGFDHEAVIEAFGKTANGRIVCWRRPH